MTNRSDHSLEKYFAEISKFKLLSTDEEILLSKKVSQGDRSALQSLINSNLRFVVSVAKQYQNLGVPLCDLINEGNIGLIEAAKRFDPTRGFKFITFGVSWIRQPILKALNEQRRMVRVPLSRINITSKLNKIVSRLEQVHERRPTIEELAEHVNMPAKEVVFYLDSFAGFSVSLDSKINPDNNLVMLDVLEGDSYMDAYLDKETLKDDAVKLLRYLSGKERAVIEMVFGLKKEDQMTLDQIAVEFNLGKERIRQIKDDAILKLKYFGERLKTG